MQRLYRFLLIFLSLATGCVFLYSAYTKLFPIQAFEYTLLEDAHMPRMAAVIAARFFIALEGSLGALIVLHFFGKGKWVLKTAFALLVVFSLYLIYLWAANGNNVNCGCFGDTIWMSPAAALMKNAVLLLITGVLIRYHNGFSYSWTNFLAVLLPVAIITTLFIIVPVLRPYKIDLTAFYNGTETPAIDLHKGKHIIAFLNPSCIHCRKTGLKMRDDLKADTTLPFFMVLGGLKSDLSYFWNASHAQVIPYIRMDAAPFLKYTHNVTPYIIWVNNGVVEEETDYDDLTPAAIEKWMQSR